MTPDKGSAIINLFASSNGHFSNYLKAMHTVNILKV